MLLEDDTSVRHYFLETYSVLPYYRHVTATLKGQEFDGREVTYSVVKVNKVSLKRSNYQGMTEYFYTESEDVFLNNLLEYYKAIDEDDLEAYHREHYDAKSKKIYVHHGYEG